MDDDAAESMKREGGGIGEMASDDGGERDVHLPHMLL